MYKYNKLWSPVFFIMAAASYYFNCSDIMCHTTHNHSGSSNFFHFYEMPLMWFIMGLAHLGAWFKGCGCK